MENLTTLELIKSTAKEFLQTTAYAMSYNQIRFVLFLIAFLCVYFLIIHRPVKKVWILLGNIFFCIWSGWAGLVIVFGTAVIVYISSMIMDAIYAKYDKSIEGKVLKPKEKLTTIAPYKRVTRIVMLLSVGLIIALWVYVKVGKFKGLTGVVSFSEWKSGAGIIVPLGISYYTLSVTGYLLDVFWRKTKANKNFFNILIAMTYFPHIMQGPISTYDKLLKQFDNIPKFNYTRVCHGLQRMLWGYIKKMVIADRLIIYTSAVFGGNGSYDTALTTLPGFAGVEVFLAVLLSGIQLYADFSGCMDIVIGISEAMGIELEENFRQPFFSKSASEFWTRWHMTLSAWTKSYIFLPIATSPKFMKLVRNIKKSGHKHLSRSINSFVPLVTVWLFTGLWHGTGVDYILWGLYWCAMMTISNETDFIWKKLVEWLHIDVKAGYHIFWQCLRTYGIFVIGKCFTAAGGLKGFALIFKRMFAEARLWVLFDGSLYTHGLDRKNFYVALAGMLVILVVGIVHEKDIKIRETIDKFPLPVRWGIYILTILVIMILGIYGPGFNAKGFAYGAF